jgi:hypothetical protein
VLNGFIDSTFDKEVFRKFPVFLHAGELRVAHPLPEARSSVAVLDKNFSDVSNRSIGMSPGRKNQSKKSSPLPLPLSNARLSPAETAHSDDVENVLEHVSSPYRWELLEIPPVQPSIPLPKKSIHHK